MLEDRLRLMRAMIAVSMLVGGTFLGLIYQALFTKMRPLLSVAEMIGLILLVCVWLHWQLKITNLDRLMAAPYGPFAWALDRELAIKHWWTAWWNRW